MRFIMIDEDGTLIFHKPSDSMPQVTFTGEKATVDFHGRNAWRQDEVEDLVGAVIHAILDDHDRAAKTEFDQFAQEVAERRRRILGKE